MTTKTDPPYEVMGRSKRTVSRPVTAADRARGDATLHRILDARANAKANKTRLKAATAKANERLAALEEEIEQLHEAAKETVRDVLEDVEIRRSATQVFVVSLVDNKLLSQRPLTKEETAALAPSLPHTGPAPVVRHAEQDPDEAATKRQAEEEAHAARLADLLRELSPDDILRQVDAEGSATGAANDADPAPPVAEEKKGKGSKGKKKGVQLAAPALGGDPTPGASS